jgi:hypothetical protein
MIMKIEASRLAAAVILLTPLVGCAQLMGPHGWKATDTAAYSPPYQGYSVTLPPGWVKSSSNDFSATLLSRDGFDLESIRIGRANNDKAFPALKKGATPDEPTEELADDLIAEIKRESGLVGFQLVKNEPAALGGKNGIHLLIEYSSPDGVHYRQDEYAVCTAAGFYDVFYRAPVLHFYDLYHPAFQAIMQSFQFIPGTSRSR